MVAAATAGTFATLSAPAFADGAAVGTPVVDATPRTPVEVVAASPMRLDIDGRFVGTTPLRLALMPKRYVLLARTADDESAAAVRLEVDVREGEPRRVHLPAPARGGGGVGLVFVAAAVGALAVGALTAVLALR